MSTLPSLAERFVATPGSLAFDEPYCGIQTFAHGDRCVIAFPDDSRVVAVGGQWHALALGMRFALTQDAERFPVYVHAGATGILTHLSPAGDRDGYAGITLDLPVEGLEEWRNELHYYGDMSDPTGTGATFEMDLIANTDRVIPPAGALRAAQAAADRTGERHWLVTEHGGVWFCPDGPQDPEDHSQRLMPVDPKPAPKGWDVVEAATLAEQFVADPEALCYDPPFNGRMADGTGCTVAFPDGSRATCKRGPWEIDVTPEERAAAEDTVAALLRVKALADELAEAVHAASDDFRAVTPLPTAIHQLMVEIEYRRERGDNFIPHSFCIAPDPTVPDDVTLGQLIDAAVDAFNGKAGS